MSTGDDQIWPEGEQGDALQDAALSYLERRRAAGEIVRDALGSVLAPTKAPPAC